MQGCSLYYSQLHLQAPGENLEPKWACWRLSIKCGSLQNMVLIHLFGLCFSLLIHSLSIYLYVLSAFDVPGALLNAEDEKWDIIPTLTELNIYQRRQGTRQQMGTPNNYSQWKTPWREKVWWKELKWLQILSRDSFHRERIPSPTTSFIPLHLQKLPRTSTC